MHFSFFFSGVECGGGASMGEAPCPAGRGPGGGWSVGFPRKENEAVEFLTNDLWLQVWGE